jgi:Phage-integrase repeat unit
MGDWLGAGKVAPGQYRTFKKARAFVRKLGLNSVTEWKEYCNSGKKPADIPAKPDNGYLNNGWAGHGDWLGTGRVATSLRQYRSFKEARAFARGLGLKSGAEWRDYSKSGKKPTDIPASPEQTYAEAGWAGFGDWLGTGRVARGHHRAFKKARTFVRSLGLKSHTEWLRYCKSGKKPVDIPAAPRWMYANDGWAGFGDWLGAGRLATHLQKYRSFKKARAFCPPLG